MESKINQLDEDIHQINLSLIKMQYQIKFLRNLILIILGLRLTSGVTDQVESKIGAEIFKSILVPTEQVEPEASNPANSLPFGLVR